MHVRNLLAEEYLYWYRRGLQPVLERSKERNSFICNRVVENHADEIVAFKNGYFLTQPAFYVSRNGKQQSKINKLNEYLYRSGKTQADNELIDWFHTVGKAILFVKPNDDPEVPVKTYALDPRSAFVVRSMSAGNKPVMGIHLVAEDDKILIDVYTKYNYFKLSGSSIGKLMSPTPNFVATANMILEEKPNVLGMIPFVEYKYNSINMGAFESVIPLLDCLNNVLSNRVDGIEQFIQSLVVLYNCELPDDESANSIKEKGLLILKSIGENKASVDILSQELNQTQSQVLVDYLYEQILRICAMPSTTKGGTSTSDTGSAVLYRDGWYQADAAARNTEDLFRKSNRAFDKMLIEILSRKNLLNISLNDFELHFVRNETANVQSKAQAAQTLLSAGFHPELAFAKSGISNDPVSDVKMSDKYLKMIWGDPDKVEQDVQQGVESPEGEAEIVEDDQNRGDNPNGGAV